MILFSSMEEDIIVTLSTNSDFGSLPCIFNISLFYVKEQYKVCPEIVFDQLFYTIASIAMGLEDISSIYNHLLHIRGDTKKVTNGNTELLTK